MLEIKKFLYREEKSVAKAAFYYLSCQVLIRGMGFITTPVFTRLMSKAQYGEVANFFAWEALLYPVLTLNMEDSIGKARFDFEKNNDQFILSILSASNLFTIISLVVFVIFNNFFSSIFEMNVFRMVLMCFYITSLAAFNFQQMQYNVFYKYKRFAIYTVLLTFVRLVLSIVLVVVSHNKSDARIVGYVIPTVILGMILGIRIKKRGKQPQLNQIKYAIKISFPLLVSTISSSILGQSDRVIITKYCGSEEAAMYSVAYTISSIASIVRVALKQAWAPWLRDSFNNGKFESTRYYSVRFSIIYGILIIFLMLSAPELVIILGGEAYAESIWAMPAVILSIVVNFIYTFYYEVEYFYNAIPYISAGTILSAVLNIVLNLIYVPRYGYIAASYTTLVCNIFILIFNYFTVRFKLKKISIFDNKKIFFILFMLCMMQIIIAMTYNLIAIRYLILFLHIFIIVFIIIKNRMMICAFIERHK